jgi:ferritin
MLSAKIQSAINAQLNLELESSYAYLGMAAFFEAIAMPGMAKWMRVQSEEEHTHAMRLFEHVHARGGTVTLQPIEKPLTKFKSPLSVFEASLTQERRVTVAINKLYALAQSEQDYATQVMLQWFINEQVEEEKNVGTLIDRLRMAGDSPSALLMLDQLLGGRTEGAEAGPRE